MIKQSILTKTEKKVIDKKLSGEKMTLQDSYYLSVSIRPKLKEMIGINAKQLLQKLAYNQKAISIEKKIREGVLRKIDKKKIQAIVLYGSVVQTNYSEYNDIDILIVVKSKIWKNSKEKYGLVELLNQEGLNNGLDLDIQILTEKELNLGYSRSPSLIYQLDNKKVIYGKVNLPKKIELYNADLKMKLDWSEVQDDSSQEIYNALRNAVLVKLLLRKIIDNKVLQEEIGEEIGERTVDNLKNNKASIEERKLAKFRLKNLVEELDRDLQGELWEKRVQLKV